LQHHKQSAPYDFFKSLSLSVLSSYQELSDMNREPYFKVHLYISLYS